MISRNRGRPTGLAILLVASTFGLGCSPSGTGSVNVKGPADVQAKLDRSSPTNSKKGATDELGAKFRKKGGE